VKKLVSFLISLYLLPLTLYSRLALYAKGRILTYEEHYLVVIDVIRRYYHANTGVIADIGAYDGDSSIYFAKRLKNSKVLAFEPNPISFQKARTNIAAFNNIELFDFGFYKHKGTLDFYVTGNQVSSSLLKIRDFSEISLKEKITVKVETLNEFFSSYPEILLMKLDVQGAELDLLKAGTETLKKTRLILTEVSVVEMYEGGCLYYQLDEFLREHGFQIHTIITNYNHEGTKYFDILYKKITNI
jgi:FkbM family methyltransferase